MSKVFVLLLVLVFVCSTFGASVSGLVESGNALYSEGDFDGAIGEYDKAVEIDPKTFEAKFNKGASLFRKGEINRSLELFRDVAAGCDSAELAEKAKYNLGNCHFRRGRETSEQEQPDMKKAIADYKASVNDWRQVLDMDKSNLSATRNIEIAKAAIRKLMEQQKQQDKQQQEQSEDGEEDKDKDQQQQEQQGQEEGQENNEKQEQQSQQEQQQQEEEKKQEALDSLAEEILKKEKDDRKKREMLLLRREPVEKDW
jgi:tetratricopeptide (TPR) repeat protein